MAAGRRMTLLPRILAAVGLLLGASGAPADDVREMLDTAGYRPYAAHTAEFVESLDTATIAVHPTMVRRETRTAVSFRSQAEVIEKLNAAGINAVRGGRRIDLGPLSGTSQWEVFQRDMADVAEAAEIAAKNAWNVFYSGDKTMAIRRFNQAWPLDPDNPLALWGFAVISIDRGNWEAALRYYRMAMENDPDNPRLQRDYELALRQVEKVPVHQPR